MRCKCIKEVYWPIKDLFHPRASLMYKVAPSPFRTFEVATTAPFLRISGSKSMWYHSAPDPFTCSLGLGGRTSLGLSRMSSFCIHVCSVCVCYCSYMYIHTSINYMYMYVQVSTCKKRIEVSNTQTSSALKCRRNSV